MFSAASYATTLPCNDAPLRRLLGGQQPFPHPACRPINPWVLMLSRIALGLRVANCANQNSYRRGIDSMLFQAACQCNEPRDMIIIDGFLDRLIAIGSGWEDWTFPTAVTRSILELTHRQLARGRTILLASTIEGEVTATETIHASDRMTVYSLYGMEVDGRAFEEFVDLTSDSAT